MDQSQYEFQDLKPHIYGKYDALPQLMHIKHWQISPMTYSRDT